MSRLYTILTLVVCGYPNFLFLVPVSTRGPSPGPSLNKGLVKHLLHNLPGCRKAVCHVSGFFHQRLNVLRSTRGGFNDTGTRMPQMLVFEPVIYVTNSSGM